MGLSCRHDVMELLEKRVRSRFSHRKQLIPEMEEKDCDSPGNSPRDVLAAMLTVPDSDSSTAQTGGPVQQWNSAVSQVLSTDAVALQLKLMMNQGSAALLPAVHLRCLSYNTSNIKSRALSSTCRMQSVAWHTLHFQIDTIKLSQAHT